MDGGCVCNSVAGSNGWQGSLDFIFVAGRRRVSAACGVRKRCELDARQAAGRSRELAIRAALGRDIRARLVRPGVSNRSFAFDWRNAWSFCRGVGSGRAAEHRTGYADAHGGCICESSGDAIRAWDLRACCGWTWSDDRRAATSGNFQTTLGEGSRGQAGSVRSQRIGRTIAASQLAITLVLLWKK